MDLVEQLSNFDSYLQEKFSDKIKTVIANQELTVTVDCESLLAVCQFLKTDKRFYFDALIDLCGVDYLNYGHCEWDTNEATSTGYGRGVQTQDSAASAKYKNQPRFAVVYHLLSLKKNCRIRLRVFIDNDPPVVPSVVELWPSANWFEREAFDLFGILFDKHPDLRRILTDYGFMGHPFRKDFPLIGTVEARYDAKLGRVVYEPVSIEPRTLVPKVIRAET